MTPTAHPPDQDLSSEWRRVFYQKSWIFFFFLKDVVEILAGELSAATNVNMVVVRSGARTIKLHGSVITDVFL